MDYPRLSRRLKKKEGWEGVGVFVVVVGGSPNSAFGPSSVT